MLKHIKKLNVIILSIVIMMIVAIMAQIFGKNAPRTALSEQAQATRIVR